MRTSPQRRDAGGTLELARRQKDIVWLFLANICLGGLGIPFLCYFGYKLAAATRSSIPLLYAIVIPIPFVGLIALLLLNSRATDMLRAAGLHVGLCGVPGREIRELKQQSQSGPAIARRSARRPAAEVKFSCPHCGQHLSCEPTIGGTQIGCPACAGQLVVPDAASGRETGMLDQIALSAEFKSTSRLATVSAILGVFGLLPFIGLGLGIPAIVCGACARSQIRSSGGNLRGGGLAVTGMLLGCVAFLFSLPLVVPGRHRGANSTPAETTPGRASRGTPRFDGEQERQFQGVPFRVIELTTVSGNRVWLYLPKRDVTNGSLACVLIPPAGTRLFHGIRLSEDDRPMHLPFVAAGFAVVAFDLSGPLSATLHRTSVRTALRAFSDARYGVVDALEALALVQLRCQALDRNRVYVAGHSSAGTLALQLAAECHRIRACIAFAPVCDIESRLGPESLKELDEIVPGTAAGLRNASPRRQVDRMTCPLFLFHALDDDNVTPGEIIAFRDALREQRAQVEYVAMKSGGHNDSVANEGIPMAIRWLTTIDSKQRLAP